MEAEQKALLGRRMQRIEQSGFWQCVLEVEHAALFGQQISLRQCPLHCTALHCIWHLSCSKDTYAVTMGIVPGTHCDKELILKLRKYLRSCAKWCSPLHSCKKQSLVECYQMHLLANHMVGLCVAGWTVWWPGRRLALLKGQVSGWLEKDKLPGSVQPSDFKKVKGTQLQET